MKKTIQVGSSDFKEIITENYYYVDKSLLIKEFIETGAKAILTPRPRRFGKTLNMSMLKYFFDIEKKDETKDLFRGLKIEKEEEIMKKRGRYPVIFLTFKNERYNTFEEFQEGLKTVMMRLYREKIYLLDGERLLEDDKVKFKKVLSGNATHVEYYKALSDLMYYMNVYYDEKVMIFIDEYDGPIQEAYFRGYYDELINVMKVVLTAALKDNDYLEKSLITGILRIAKESIFSGLNNIQVHTMFSYKFSDKFGFTIEEVKELLDYYNLNEKSNEIKEWYNGYTFGRKVIYNPWSVLNYICNNEIGFMPYWINSSSNELIKRLLVKGNDKTKKSLEELMTGNAIAKIIDDQIVMKEIDEDDENLWSFLTLSGYLKPVKSEVIIGRIECEL